MSDIFLNYDDVRRLFSHMSKLDHADETATIASITAGIGLADYELFPRLKLPEPPLPGINLSETVLSNLLNYAARHDLSKLRNTDRLDGLCNAFGWKADAMMHFLISMESRPLTKH